jgi:hypothetical protein
MRRGGNTQDAKKVHEQEARCAEMDRDEIYISNLSLPVRLPVVFTFPWVPLGRADGPQLIAGPTRWKMRRL